MREQRNVYEYRIVTDKFSAGKYNIQYLVEETYGFRGRKTRQYWRTRGWTNHVADCSFFYNDLYNSIGDAKRAIRNLEKQQRKEDGWVGGKVVYREVPVVDNDVAEAMKELEEYLGAKA